MQQFTNGTQIKPYLKDLYGIATYDQIVRYQNLIYEFKRQFSQRWCYVATSSGRIELVGNHTDHNGGKVLGCAISFDILACFVPNDNNTVRIKSKGHSDIFFKINDVDKVDGGSLGMAKGVLSYLQHNGYNVGGFNATIHSILPSGVGISSSAAFQMLVGAIQNSLYNEGKIPVEMLAKAGQYAENVYFGKPCGLLDQGVIAQGGVATINFANGFDAKNILSLPTNLDFVLVNTGGNHASLTAHYKAITDEMLAVSNFFGKSRLVDVNSELFFENYNTVAQKVGLRPALRAKHFFEENTIVEQAIQALEKGDTNAFVELVNKSGQSSLTQLQNCSTGENDTVIADAIAYAKQICPQCGCRVHGGGFAGTILAVVPTQYTKNFVLQTKQKYGQKAVYTLKVRKLGATVL